MYSYSFPNDLADSTSTNTDENHRYTKKAGYSTVRFPLSGLVGTDDDRAATEAYNKTFASGNLPDILNGNVSNWLNQGIDIPDDGSGARHQDTYSGRARYQACLNAPNYIVFSNKASANQWMEDHGIKPDTTIPSLEDPHNAIHLSIGGMFQKGVYEADPANFQDANGDMGENNTASLDPSFSFHHCFVDYAFWTWQKKHNLIKLGSPAVEMGYPGTTSSDPG